MTTTFDRLQDILIKDYHFAPDVLVSDAVLEDLGIDSLGTAELLFNIEDEFGVTLPPEAVQLTTLGDVVKFIDELIATQGRSRLQKGVVSDLAAPAT
jgi:acyl carrier protein